MGENPQYVHTGSTGSMLCHIGWKSQKHIHSDVTFALFSVIDYVQSKCVRWMYAGKDVCVE